MKNLLKLTLFLCLSIFTQNSWAQTVKGKVLDETGFGLPGLTVRIDGTSKGTVTNMDGSYELKLDPGKYTLLFSYIGYKTITREVTVAAGRVSTVDVKMEPDTKTLQEMVVVGYGVQRKREVTGSIARVDAAEITAIPTPSFEAALQGQAAGVQVTTGSGLAGSASVIRVRGISSISAGGDPLYVIDGVPVTQDFFLNGNAGGMNNNPLAALNPNDIESVQILKDAASTGIYGSRGANGVILITTKRAKKTGLNFDFQSRVGISLPTALPNMLNSKQYLQLYQEAWENDGNAGRAQLPFGISWDLAERTNTDWVRETVGVGMKHAYSFGVTKGTEKMKMYANLSYDDNGSFLIGNSYERLSGRINLDYQLAKNLSVSATTSVSRGQNNRVDAAWQGGLGLAMSTALPITPVRGDDGEFFRDAPNPAMNRDLQQWRTTEVRSLNTLALNYTPIKNLILTATTGYDYMDLRDQIFRPQELILTDHLGFASEFPQWVNNYNANVTATYLYDINEDHSFNFLIGSEYQRNTTRNNGGIQFENIDRPLWRGVSDEAIPFRGNPGDDQIFAFLSYFARANYTFKNRYFVQAVFRTDGSSRFGKDRRFGSFPSVSAGWIISDENWFNSNLFSFLKVRASYGITGNANIPNFQRFGTFSPRDNPNAYNGMPVIFPMRLENPELRWETSRVTDFAIEAGMLDDRITMELGLYNRRTTDVLMDLLVPRTTGFGNFWDNVGEIVNRGVEFSLRSRNVVGKFEWTTDFNIAYNYNEIVSIGPYSEDAVSGGTNDTRVVVGQPVGTNFLVRFSHVDPATGRPVYLDINGNPTFTWDPADRVPVGSVLPDAVGGITNTFRYKQWDLIAMFTFTIGADIYDSSSKRQLGVVTDWNMRTEIFDRWQQPGDMAAYPRLTLNTQTHGAGTPWINTDQWLHRADFIRFRRLSLGYTFNDFNISKVNIRNCRVSFTAANFMTFTNFPGLDPEIARDFENDADRNMSPNITFLTPPQEQSYILQINFNF
ncbi:MAG: SusC/RagA family TonB-linked outer membrane protein [Luteibaculaceae bacterium]